MKTYLFRAGFGPRILGRVHSIRKASVEEVIRSGVMAPPLRLSGSPGGIPTPSSSFSVGHQGSGLSEASFNQLVTERT